MLNPFGIFIGLFIVVIFTTYYLLQRQITQRKRAEKILRQQTERERLVSQIAHHIRKSLNLDEVLVTTAVLIQTYIMINIVGIIKMFIITLTQTANL